MSKIRIATLIVAVLTPMLAVHLSAQQRGRGAGGRGDAPEFPTDLQWSSNTETQRRVATAMKIAGSDLVPQAKMFCTATGPQRMAVARQAAGLPPMPNVKYVSEYTHPYGMNYVKVEAVSLVTGLAGTGSDPPPTPQRASLLGEMNRREIANPNEVLASGNTSLVLVRAFLRPGIQKGDRFDVEVRVPTQSDTTSIRDGWLLPPVTFLCRMASTNG